MKIKVNGKENSREWRAFRRTVDEIIKYSLDRGFNLSFFIQLNSPYEAIINVSSSGFYIDEGEKMKYLDELRDCFPDILFDFC